MSRKNDCRTNECLSNDCRTNDIASLCFVIDKSILIVLFELFETMKRLLEVLRNKEQCFSISITLSILLNKYCSRKMKPKRNAYEGK